MNIGNESQRLLVFQFSLLLGVLLRFKSFRFAIRDGFLLGFLKLFAVFSLLARLFGCFLLCFSFGCGFDFFSLFLHFLRGFLINFKLFKHFFGRVSKVNLDFVVLLSTDYESLAGLN